MKLIIVNMKTAMGAWLSCQILPCIGLGAVGESVLKHQVDVLADSHDIDFIIDNITCNPQASAVLVQVLRSVGSLLTTQALAMESLAYGTLLGGQKFAQWCKQNQQEYAPASVHIDPDTAVLVDRTNDILQIRLNIPQNRHALSAPLRYSLAEAVKLVAVDQSIKAVIVIGNGPCFSAGGDLSEFGKMRDLTLGHMSRAIRMPAAYLALAADRYTFHLHRACIGAGIEMPAFGKYLMATPDTVFRLPEVAMGLIPGAGGCVSIPRRIDRQRCAYMAISGAHITAERALSWGLIDTIKH